MDGQDSITVHNYPFRFGKKNIKKIINGPKFHDEFTVLSSVNINRHY